MTGIIKEGSPTIAFHLRRWLGVAMALLQPVALAEVAITNHSDSELFSALPPVTGVQEYQRALYKQAKTALARGEQQTFGRLLGQLTDYPLAPYLQYADYASRLAHADKDDLARFLHQYPGAPFSTTLRQRWLTHLADRSNWQDFIRFYDSSVDSTKLKCHYGHALFEKGFPERAAVIGVDLWIAGKSQPKECDPLFKMLVTNGYITDSIAWQRYTAAIFNHQYRLARYITRFFAEEKTKSKAELYMEVDQDPRLLSSFTQFAENSPEEREIIRHGLVHLAPLSPQTALDLWNRYHQTHTFNGDQEADIVATLIKALYRAGHTESANRYLIQVQEVAPESLLDWRLQELIKEANWTAITDWSNQLIPKHRNSDRWRYWRARALELSGSNNKAEVRTLYKTLSVKRSFYGFLASEWLKTPYQMEEEPVDVSPQQLTELANSPAFRRIRELYHHQETYWAQREWYSALATANEQHWLVAAKLAQLWQWHSQAIMSMIRVGYWNDIEIRFPSPFQNAYLSQSEATQIPINLLLALSRQESAFNPEVTSPAGAKGLMQLMPATARETARRHNIRLGSSRELYDPEKNILIGSRYYKELLKKFNNNRILATAAYNAGPSRVQRWQRQSAGALPFDAWIETIPFLETRNYVQNVLAFSIIYAHLLGLEAPILNVDEKNTLL